MSSTPTATTTQRRTYGYWRRPLSAGLRTVSTLGTLLIFATLIATVLTFMISQSYVAALVVCFIGGVLVFLVVKTDKYGYTVGQRIFARLAWWRTRASGSHLYRSGVLGKVPWGTAALPGAAATTRLYESVDAWDRPFAVVHMPGFNYYTVVLRADPDGATLVDQEVVDQWVANWGGWLAGAGNEEGLISAAVTIETAPDSGQRLRQRVRGMVSEDAPDFAQAVMAEVADEWATGSTRLSCYIALTFAGQATRGKDTAAILRSLASRLPGFTHSLSTGTGAGAVIPMAGDELCELVRVAYDPQVVQQLDELSNESAEHDLRWSGVGPMATEAAWGHYRHDSAVSVTWSMPNPPSGVVTSDVLRPLLAPSPDLPRKRVTFLFRPIDAAHTAWLVESDKRNADVRASGDRPPARAVMEKRIADRVAEEESHGAGLVDFGVLVTTTLNTYDDEDASGLSRRLRETADLVQHLAGQARVSLRPVYGSQDSAFAAGLPLGLVLPRMLRVPTELRRMM